MEDTESAPDDAEVVRTLLASQGLHPPDADLASLTRQYPALRRRMDRMYAVETGDEVMAAVFRAHEVPPSQGREVS